MVPPTDPTPNGPDPDATKVRPAATGSTSTIIQSDAQTVVGPVSTTPTGTEPVVGSTIRGRFRIESTLGRGGMGQVFLALDLLKLEAGDDEPYVAIKVLHAQIANADITFKALQREAKRAQQLAHPNIVTVYDFDRSDGLVYMSMEVLHGEDSKNRVEGHLDGLPPASARAIVRDVAAGLGYAHKRGITHADLKPQNVFLTTDGRAKLLDFGIARAHNAGKIDEVDQLLVGYTPAYASTEILAGGKPTPSDDVYALGCVAYYYYTGRHPFDMLPADQARAAGLKPTRPRGMRRAEWHAVSRALQFDAGKRPRDANQFMRRFSPSRIKRIMAAAIVMAAVAALGLGLWLGGGQGPATPFEDLPPAVQASIDKNLHDAALLAQLGDLNASLQLYASVLKAHPGDTRATDGMNVVVGRILATTRENLDAGRLSPAAARQVYKTLLDYDTLPAKSRKMVNAAQAGG